jgi:endonuclease YncB( thermonuclease family)
MLILFLSLPAQTSLAGKSSSYKELNSKLCPIGLIDFDDGDSFTCEGEQIRVLGIDAPEIKHPEHGITEDQKDGMRAASTTQSILKSAKRILIIRDGKDPYHRTKAHVIVDGELLGVKLIKKGLAYETISIYGDNGFPEFSLQMIEASQSHPKPDFEEPWKWRKVHQQKKGEK